jgi:hypothetical protein
LHNVMMSWDEPQTHSRTKSMAKFVCPRAARERVYFSFLSVC